MSEFVGRQLGDYRIIESIGAGGMGEVYLAEHVHLRKRYALKVLPRGLAQDRDFVARFHDEARVMAELRHPHIVQVQYMGHADDVYFLAMDYVTGPGGSPESMHQRLKSQPENHLPEADVKKWAIQIAEALAYAHERGLVHRDLKPANILLDENDDAKLTDFGLAKAIGQEFINSQIHETMRSLGSLPTQRPAGANAAADTMDVADTQPPDGSRRGSSASSILGTYDYMAPEQRGEGTGQVDQRADIYSFGVVLYRLLTGERPTGFAKPPAMAVPGLSNAWDEITARCLEKAPANRYSSASELLSDLHSRREHRCLGIAVVALAAIAVLTLTCLGYWVLTSETASPASEEQPLVASDVKLPPEQTRGTTVPDHADSADEGLPDKRTTQRKQPSGTGLQPDRLPMEGESARAGRATYIVAEGDSVTSIARNVLGNENRWREIFELNREKLASPDLVRVGMELKMPPLGQRPRTLASITGSSADKIQNRSAVYEVQLGDTLISIARAHYGDGKYWELIQRANPDMDPARFKVGQIIYLPPTGGAERQEQVSGLLGIARANDSKANGRIALRFLEKLLAIEPDHAEALRMKKRIEGYYAPPPTLELDLGEGAKLELVLIPAGEFMMGSPVSEEGRYDNEGPQHRVRISRPFYMGKYEVTQAQWQAVMGNNPSFFSASGAGRDSVAGMDTSRFPVECVSWTDCQEFCRELSVKKGQTVRLPTEAEWEYACRAGTSTPFHFGATISTDQANYDGHSEYHPEQKGTFRRTTTPVGTFAANAAGLHDVHGNVWEWCEDYYAGDYYTRSPTTDPRGPGSGSIHVWRGGNWILPLEFCRSAKRGGAKPSAADYNLGFRVVVEIQ